MGGFFHPKRACVAATTLVGLHKGTGHHFEHFLRFLANVLHAAVARNLVADFAQAHRKFGFNQPVALARHEVFKRVPHGRLHRLHRRILRVHQRNFLLEHQRAAGHSTQYGITFSSIFGQHWNIGFFASVHGIQIA